VEVLGRANVLIRLARRFRYGALAAFEAGLPVESASVLGGVVLGEKKSVPPALKAAFQDSGAMHLLVASGSNVGFVVAVVYFLSARLGLRRKYAGLAALLLAGFYVTAVGLEPPLVRAYLMFSVGLCAWLLKREAGAFHALTAACLAILLTAPRYLFDAGFQMSFLAAYGLIAGMALWGGYARLGGLAGRAAGLFLMSFFAQLGLYPLLALYFHKVSLISLVSNMVLVPASGVAMALGFLLAAFSGAGVIFKPLAFAAGVFMEAFIKAVRFFAELPFASVSVPRPSAWVIAGFFMLAFTLLHAPLLGFRRRRLYLAALSGLAVMGAGPLAGFLYSGAGRECGAVPFGDSNTAGALVSCPPGGLYLVNPGVDGKKLAAAVFDRGTRALDAVMLTSVEEKNYSGLDSLAARVRIKNIFLPYGPQPEEFRRLLARLENAGARVSRVWPGESREAGVKLVCRWGGYAPGYSGRADVYSWDIGSLNAGKEGKYSGPARLPPGSAREH
jgi:competence protein ComEC